MGDTSFPGEIIRLLAVPSYALAVIVIPANRVVIMAAVIMTDNSFLFNLITILLSDEIKENTIFSRIPLSMKRKTSSRTRM